MEVELRKDPREAITPVVAAAILVNYFLLPVYLGVILLRRIQVLLYMDMLDLQGPAVPGCDPLRIRAGSERASSNPVGPGGGGAGTVNGPGLLGGQCNQPAAGVRRAPGVPLDRWLAIPVELWCKEWLQAAMSQSLANKPKDVEVVKPGLTELRTLQSTSVLVAWLTKPHGRPPQLKWPMVE